LMDTACSRSAPSNRARRPRCVRSVVAPSTPPSQGCPRLPAPSGRARAGPRCRPGVARRRTSHGQVGGQPADAAEADRPHTGQPFRAVPQFLRTFQQCADVRQQSRTCQGARPIDGRGRTTPLRGRVRAT
jgi:hypothetical protein